MSRGMDINEPSAAGHPQDDGDRATLLHRRGYQGLATAYALPVRQVGEGRDSRAIGTLASGPPSVGFAAELEAAASVHCGPGLDVITGNLGGVHPAPPAIVAHTMGGLPSRDLSPCGPRNDLHLRRCGPYCGDSGCGDELAARRSGRQRGARRGLGRLARPASAWWTATAPYVYPRCSAVTAPCGAPDHRRAVSAGLERPKASASCEPSRDVRTVLRSGVHAPLRYVLRRSNVVSMSRRGWRVPILLGLAVGALLLQVGPAGAVPSPTPPAAPPQVRGNTEMMDGRPGPRPGGHRVHRHLDNPFTRTPTPIPRATRASGCDLRERGSPASSMASRPAAARLLEPLLHRHQHHHVRPDRIRAGHLGRRRAVPNVGYVARLLNDYYPNTDEPAGLTDLNQKAAAVQAAIWFFSDGYVLSTSDDAAARRRGGHRAGHQNEGPLIEPPPPSLTIIPPSRSGPAGHLIGPFTVTPAATAAAGARPSIAVTATGGSMFSDAAGVPIRNGTKVPSGQTSGSAPRWLSCRRARGDRERHRPQRQRLPLRRQDGRVPNGPELILAENATLSTTVQATADFLRPGSLVVTKTIAMTGAVLCEIRTLRRPHVSCKPFETRERQRQSSAGLR